MADVLFVDTQIILASTALMSSVMAVMNFAILYRTAPTRFLHQEHLSTKKDLIQGINTPTTEGTDHTPIMVPDIGDISADHSPAAIPTVTETAVLEGTHHALLLATTANHTTLWIMDAPITPNAMVSTGIVTPHPTLTTSPADVTPTTAQTRAGVAQANSHSNGTGISAQKSQTMPKTLNPS